MILPYLTSCLVFAWIGWMQKNNWRLKLFLESFARKVHHDFVIASRFLTSPSYCETFPSISIDMRAHGKIFVLFSWIVFYCKILKDGNYCVKVHCREYFPISRYLGMWLDGDEFYHVSRRTQECSQWSLNLIPNNVLKIFNFHHNARTNVYQNLF